MHRSTSAYLSLIPLAALLFVACGSDDGPTSPTDTPTEIVEAGIPGRITVNGAATHQFVVGTTGTVRATLTALSPDPTAVVGLSLGTWNGASCQIIIANTNATLNTTVFGTASVGNFCVYVQDVGRLTAPVNYELTVGHY